MRRATLGVLLAVACGGGAVMGPGGEGAGAEAAGTEAAGTEAAVRDGSAEVAAEDGDAVASGEGAESPTGPGSASGESSPDGARAGVERGESGGAPTSGGDTGAGPADASNDPEASAMDARRAPAACPAEAPEGMACVGGGCRVLEVGEGVVHSFRFPLTALRRLLATTGRSRISTKWQNTLPDRPIVF